MKCEKCNIDMKIGQALWPFDMLGRASYWICSMGRPLAKLLIPCWKCPSCGKSEELSNKEYHKLKDKLICTHDWRVHKEILCSNPGQLQRTCNKCGKYERMYLDGSGIWA